jgi:hypothetical protein
MWKVSFFPDPEPFETGGKSITGAKVFTIFIGSPNFN